MKLLDGLNAQQQAVVTHGAGPLLVVAGAGTGKTLTLASRVAWLLQQGADPNRLLLITFSRRAAAELARRAGRLLHQSLGLPTTAPPPRLPWCGTFHSVAARLLREHAADIGLAEGFSVLDRADAQDLLALARQTLGLAEGGGSRFPMPSTCLAIHSRCLNTRQALGQVLREHHPWCAERESDLSGLFAAFGEAKLQQQSLDFDDLLLAWWHLMQVPALSERVRARFSHVLVDEVQDVNRLQLELLQALQPSGQGLTAVGDDAQSIYAFRGADVEHILTLPQSFSPSATVLTLEQNFRSTPQVLQASNAVIALAARRFDKTLWSDRPEGLRPRLITVADEAAQARAVADAVLADRETGLSLKRQAVLFRTGTHSAALELELTRRNIPFVKYGGLRFLEAAHVKDLLALLRWADNPASRLSALRTARLVPGMGPASVARLLAQGCRLEAFSPPPAAAAAWAALVDLLQALREGRWGWPHDLAAAMNWYRPHLQRLHDDPAARWADLEQLQQLAPGYGHRERFITELTLDPPEACSQEAGVPLRDEDYLVLSTLHSAKGQEWPSVHILNVVDGCLPADLATGRAAEVEEERRLLYVGMTRARDALSLWVPQRFHVTQQRALGNRHLYALRSRFIPPSVLPWFDQCSEPDPSSTAALASAWPPSPQAAAQPHSGASGAAPPTADALALAFDLGAALRRGWQTDVAPVQAPQAGDTDTPTARQMPRPAQGDPGHNAA